MTTEKKILSLIGIGSVILVIGAVFWLGKDSFTPVSEDQIITRTGLHWHPKLAIYLNGQKQELADGIGMGGTVHQRMHTHTEDFKEGVVHMEMQGLVTKDDTQLGKFFQIWGKDFNSRKILDKEATAEGQIKMTVNGQGNTEFENYLMKEGDRIEIKYE